MTASTPSAKPPASARIATRPMVSVGSPASVPGATTSGWAGVAAGLGVADGAGPGRSAAKLGDDGSGVPVTFRSRVRGSSAGMFAGFVLESAAVTETYQSPGPGNFWRL